MIIVQAFKTVHLGYSNNFLANMMNFSSHSPQNQGNHFPSLKRGRFDCTMPKDSLGFSVVCEFKLS